MERWKRSRLDDVVVASTLTLDDQRHTKQRTQYLCTPSLLDCAPLSVRSLSLRSYRKPSLFSPFLARLPFYFSHPTQLLIPVLLVTLARQVEEKPKSYRTPWLANTHRAVAKLKGGVVFGGVRGGGERLRSR